MILWSKGLGNPVPVRFLVQTEKRGSMAVAAVTGIACFLRRRLYRFLGGKAATAATPPGAGAADTRGGGSKHGGP